MDFMSFYYAVEWLSLSDFDSCLSYTLPCSFPPFLRLLWIQDEKVKKNKPKGQ